MRTPRTAGRTGTAASVSKWFSAIAGLLKFKAAGSAHAKTPDATAIAGS